jgi:uncharacterized MAPEG superfamily protein
MTIPLWSLFAAVNLPYVWATISMQLRKKQLGSLDNNNPREQQKQMTGAAARAHAAQMNAWEALAVFTPAVLVAHVANPGSGVAPILAIAWVVLRIAHGVMYLADLATPRSAMFMMGMLCNVGLFLTAARFF